jgi:hypothetical protein
MKKDKRHETNESGQIDFGYVHMFLLSSEFLYIDHFNEVRSHLDVGPIVHFRWPKKILPFLLPQVFCHKAKNLKEALTSNDY